MGHIYCTCLDPIETLDLMNLWSIIYSLLSALCGHRLESHVLMQKWGAKHITLRSKGMQHGFRCVFCV